MSYTPSDNDVVIMPVVGIPEVEPHHDLHALLIDSLASSTAGLQSGDVLLVTHKIVSKAEGQLVDLATVEPSNFARQWADSWNKDARQVEVVLQESKRMVRMHNGLIVAETHHGLICANAGVDAGNAGQNQVVLLPKDPDASAQGIRQALIDHFFHRDAAAKLGVIITDSFGRPWRNGIVNVAIGSAGISPVVDYRGQHDPTGYELRATVLAVADELASAGELVMHKTHRVPAAVVRNYEWDEVEGTAAALVMPEERNLFK
jgi:coenzyme F420-0:L-glutamate ligase / coenzyme F420-1:gamma-L-glutamate ligase